jgi:hypothetical protein
MSSSTNNTFNDFIATFQNSITTLSFVKMTLSDPRNKSGELRNVYLKPVQLKNGYQLNFVYRYSTKDITKNYAIEDSVNLIRQLLLTDFLKSDLFEVSTSHHLSFTKSGNVISSKKNVSNLEKPNLLHNKEKKRFIQVENNVYLKSLGIYYSGWKSKKR